MEETAASNLRIAQEELTSATLKVEAENGGTNVPNYTTSYSRGLNIFRCHLGLQSV
jgi:hypothetical protein